MKVLLATPTVNASVGGIARSTPELAVALKANACHLRIFTPEAEHPVDAIKQLSQAELICTKLRADRCPKAWRNHIDALVISESRPDLIHQAGMWLSFSRAVTKTASTHSIPLIVAPRGMLEPWAINNSKWKKKLAWALYQKRDLEKATAFHATAQSEAESIRRLGFKQPIAVIPNGIVLPDGSKIGDGRSKMEDGRWQIEDGRSELNKSSHIPYPISDIRKERTALFLSRINPKKGLPMLLDAWKRVAPEGWRLVIAGNDDSNHLPIIEAKIREHRLEEQVEIVGPLFGADKERAYREADLFVLPSYSENFGIVVAEALGYGVPVLTTTGCPWQELQTHNCGWWVEPTPAGIEQGLNEALGTKNQELYAMGARGRALVEEKYQWPGIAERMLEFYEWILRGEKQPDFVV